VSRFWDVADTAVGSFLSIEAVTERQKAAERTHTEVCYIDKHSRAAMTDGQSTWNSNSEELKPARSCIMTSVGL